MTNPVHRIHRRIARIAFYLLNNSMDSIDSEVLAHRYRNLLLRNGLAHYNGQIRATKLINKIKESYPEELLPEIGCDIKTTRRVNRLVSTCQTKDIQHPIRHLLLLAYLDCQPEEIFDNFAEFKPFGHGPWPCLNPAVDHYKEPRILLCRVLPGAKKDRGKPRGVFACSCGFVYARLGPDALESDRFTYSIVQSYGPSWETLLRKLWPDKSYNIDTIANRLGVQIRTVKRRVVAFGLPIRRCDGESTKARIPNCYRLRRESKATLLKKKKEQILLVLAEKPEVDRSELWKIAYSQMIYIQRADPQWLRHHLPPPKQKYPCRPPLDWPSEDVLLAKAVKGAVAEIKDSEVLERVSIGSIIRRIDESGRLRKHLDKMPLTASILNSSLESKDNYLLRRIRWFEAAFRKEQIKPSRWGFIRRAAIRRDVTAANEAVRQAVDDALLRLNC